MNDEIVDIELVKKWYRQYWEDFMKVDTQYKSWQDKRNQALSWINNLRPILQSAGVDISELENKGKLDIDSVETGRFDIKKTLPDLIYEILEVSGKPMHYSNILDELVTRGVVVSGKDPRNTILAYITRYKKRFSKAPEVGKGFYKLIKET